MNERDRERIAYIRRSINEGDCPPYCIGPITDLFKIIERLDKQLTEILEAGGPFNKYVKQFMGLPDGTGDPGFYEGGEPLLTAGDFRRLAQAMKGVKDE